MVLQYFFLKHSTVFGAYQHGIYRQEPPGHFLPEPVMMYLARKNKQYGFAAYMMVVLVRLKCDQKPPQDWILGTLKWTVEWSS